MLEGARFPAADPVVKAHGDMFEPVPKPRQKRGRRAAEGGSGAIHSSQREAAAWVSPPPLVSFRGVG